MEANPLLAAVDEGIGWLRRAEFLLSDIALDTDEVAMSAVRQSKRSRRTARSVLRASRREGVIADAQRKGDAGEDGQIKTLGRDESPDYRSGPQTLTEAAKVYETASALRFHGAGSLTCTFRAIGQRAPLRTSQLMATCSAFDPEAPGLVATTDAIPVLVRSLAGIATVTCVASTIVVVR